MEYEGYLIKPHKTHPRCYIVATAGQGGKIPDVLNTMFTSTGIAKSQIDQYLMKKSLVENGRTYGRKAKSES